VSRPSIRRALKRAGIEKPPRPPRPPGPRGSRNIGAIPPPKIFLPGESLDAGLLDFAALFGRRAPVELEIGIGKGRFLLQEAAAHPGRSYFGLEIEPEYTLIACAKAESLGLANIRIERLDGKAFVMKRLFPASLAALHVYFPDPWPKKRHHKRRLFDSAFAAAAAAALEPHGLLRVASDHADYFAVIEAVLSSEPALERVPDETLGPWETGTNYELKFVKSGRPIHRLVFRRR
jgi:tRNA (guanine-N7-)-methyltransferase